MAISGSMDAGDRSAVESKQNKLVAGNRGPFLLCRWIGLVISGLFHTGRPSGVATAAPMPPSLTPRSLSFWKPSGSNTHSQHTPLGDLGEIHGAQEGSAYNGHCGCACYHPLFVFNRSARATFIAPIAGTMRRSIRFQMAEVMVSREVFQQILAAISALRPSQPVRC
jgi:hypothetical protein